ncbi:MAG: epoxide hydrolase [Rhodospirillaceae bacterium]|nr:epoxide hydrolase [Rhodospirillaceae bacterium]MYB14277.1 epoxide hydrolase [Rhodospirillaceae bacterium]MYI48355.1 epoxide hydrolase [Rhodospirillaceae bacterium]
MSPTPFTIDVPQEKLDRILHRVREFPWPDETVDSGWALGPDPDWLRDFCRYWIEAYDWRGVEARLNELPHFRAEADGLALHYVHCRSPRPDATPLLLVHGWPGSFIEFEDMIGPLTDPAAHGAPDAPAFHVVAPSLPGYAFSDKPPAPIGPRRMAGHIAALMGGVLGYDGYIAQGGDWGSVICGWIGHDHAAGDRRGGCGAVHLNMFGVRPSQEREGGGIEPVPPQTEEEEAWRRKGERWRMKEGGYFHVQATKPEALAYAMLDSPVGVAAWIGEKFRTWIDGQQASLDRVIGRERLLTNLMLYIVNDAFGSASWTYYGYGQAGDSLLPPGGRVTVPTGIANFPREIIPFPPRPYVEKGYNVAHWTDMPRGGHFAAMEAPDLLLADIRAFASAIG